jgi:hypothetical protein
MERGGQNSREEARGFSFTDFPQSRMDAKWYMVYQISPPLYQKRNGGVKRKNPEKIQKKGKRKGWIFLLLGREDFTNILRVGEEERRWGTGGSKISLFSIYPA